MSKAVIKRPKVDWLEAKKYYVENPTVTLREVAEKYSVSLNTVATHSKKEEWVKTQQDIAEETMDRVVDKAAEERSQLTTDHAQKFALAENISVAMMTRLAKKIRRLEQNDPEAVTSDYNLMSPQQWNFLVTALKTATDGRRTALGLPSTITKTDNDINILNPYQGFTPQQLLGIIRQNETEIRAKYAREGDIISPNGTSETPQ